MAKTILSSNQRLLLHLLSSNLNIQKYFYLSGGTALAEYYLHHRYSEDLDFLTETEIDPISIQSILKSISNKAKIKEIDYQQSFNRNLFYLHFNKEVIKTEFTYYPFTPLKSPKIVDGLKIDNLLDIAINKTFTIYQKPRSRDFIDLYLIIKEGKLRFEDLRKKARLKFDTHMDPLQMAQRLLESDHLEDFPRMIIPLKPKVWRNFWKLEADKLKSEVLI